MLTRIHVKKEVYCRTGVTEYIVWQVLKQTICWFHLEEGRYQELKPDFDGISRSRTFPGLWLAIADLLAGNMRHVLETLNQGTRSSEHDRWLASIAQENRE